MDIFRGEYCHAINSDDVHDPELPFVKNRSNGGTMIMWKKSMNQFVSIIPTTTPSFMAMLFHPPGCIPSLHVSIYLPTSGRESDFIEEITKLRIFLVDHQETHPGTPIFIRGDSNVNTNNTVRLNIFNDFKSSLKMFSVPIEHKTYHHFLGNGVFDSNIDVIMHSGFYSAEKIENVFCQSQYPFINSHHDLISSSFILQQKPLQNPPPKTQAPVIENVRKKVIWSPEALTDYQELIGDNLSNLRRRWLQPASRTSVSILLQSTSEILCLAAAATNKSLKLSETKTIKSKTVPKPIKRSLNYLKRKRNSIKNLFNAPDASALKKAKAHHRRLIRSYRGANMFAEDQKMFSLMSSSPSSVFRKIKASKKSSVEAIPFLKVGSDVYHGENVKNGFFDSISRLKSKSYGPGKANEVTVDFMEDYKHILDLCKNKRDLPRISLQESMKILKKMKSGVIDFYSITPAHFINAGDQGFEHFNFLFNCIIDDVNNATIEEMNSCYALLLFKGHGKLKTSDKSYRTISTCPFLSKALDLYIRELQKEKWNHDQAQTQYQGEGSSHDLAALLLTEVIQQSVFTLKEPCYLLFLDAMSAFDKVVPELLIRNLYLAGMDGNTTNYINNRLTNRITYIDWDKSILGPIKDEQGLEQGGIKSSDLYKVYSNENLTTAQNSAQGVDLGGSQVISAIGFADDTALSANKLSNLSNILYLTTKYCEKYCVTLCAEKTKLLRISKCDSNSLEVYNPINIDGSQIDFSEEAEHVGVIRSTKGNIAHLLSRICAHRKALGATLSAGVAQKSRANPVVGLRLEKVYGSPVLLSGVSSLVLNASEIAMIDNHQKDTYRNIQKLHKNTPSCVVYFLGGCLPGEAAIHLRMLGIFGMVTRLSNDPLNIHARNVLITAKSSSKSWFWQLRDICLKYQLPHPLKMLDNPPKKEVFMRLVKAKVVDYWEKKLRGESSLLSSLVNFKPEFMSLTKPHLIWTTAGSNPYEVSKAIQQARFLSGRYRTENLAKHWSRNKEGYCLSPTCQNQIETVQHILIECPAYLECKKRLYSLWLSSKNPVVYHLILAALSTEKEYLLQFLLDCSVLPEVITATQSYGEGIFSELFYLTRTWCFSVHRERMKMLGRWNFQ